MLENVDEAIGRVAFLKENPMARSLGLKGWDVVESKHHGVWRFGFYEGQRKLLLQVDGNEYEIREPYWMFHNDGQLRLETIKTFVKTEMGATVIVYYNFGCGEEVIPHVDKMLFDWLKEQCPWMV